MESQSVRLEREVEESRRLLSQTLEELRSRMPPGRVIDQVIDYTRHGAAANFVRKLGREALENPMPLVVIGIGIAWLIVASGRTSRVAMASATGGAISEWRQQTEALLRDEASVAASTTGDETAEILNHARDVNPGFAERAGARPGTNKASVHPEEPLADTDFRAGRYANPAQHSL